MAVSFAFYARKQTYSTVREGGVKRSRDRLFQPEPINKRVRKIEPFLVKGSSFPLPLFCHYNFVTFRTSSPREIWRGRSSIGLTW